MQRTSKPWQILGVSKGASVQDIKRAYRQKALLLHPDKNDSPHAGEDFQELRQAYDLLMNPKWRRRFMSDEPQEERHRDPAYRPARSKAQQAARDRVRREHGRQWAMEQKWIFMRQKKALRASWAFYPLMLLAYLVYASIFVLAFIIASVPVVISSRFNDQLWLLTGIMIWPMCLLLLKRTGHYRREILVYFR